MPFRSGLCILRAAAKIYVNTVCLKNSASIRLHAHVLFRSGLCILRAAAKKYVNTVCLNNSASIRLHAHVLFRSGLRMLRAAAKIQGVQVVLTALRHLLPDLTNVLLVGLLFYYVFSVSRTTDLSCGVLCPARPDQRAFVGLTGLNRLTTFLRLV